MFKLCHLEIVKGISILMIMAFHICGQVFQSQPEWFRILSFQGVNMFIIVSGFTLAYSTRRSEKEKWTVVYWGGWLKRRGLRILPLYWCILFISFIIYYFQFSFVRVVPLSDHAVRDFMKHALLMHVYFKDFYYSINPALWYLGIIFQLYLAFPVLFYLFNKFERSSCVPLLCLCAALFVADYFLVRTLHLIDLRKSLSSLLFFAVGIALATAHTVKRRRPSNTLRSIVFIASLLSASILLYILASQMYFSKFLYYVWLVFSLLCYASVYLISVFISSLSLSKPAKVFSALLQFFGENAYAVYLIHWGLIVPIISKFRYHSMGITVYYAVVILIGYVFTKSESCIKDFIKTKVYIPAYQRL
jgi:peptidoglycan/LPS O-acetylase OafA/YrhL